MVIKNTWQDILNRHPPITHNTMMLTAPFYAQAVEAVVGDIIELEQQLIRHNPEYVGLGRHYLIEEFSFIWLCHYRLLLSKLVVDVVAMQPASIRIVDDPADWFSNTPISSLFKHEELLK